jgi:formate dehydrogenase subunit delta
MPSAREAADSSLDMNVDRLVTMVNDIAAFFSSEPDKDEAARNVAGHITRFWDPRMRRQIAAHYRAGGSGLSDVGLAAIALIAATESAASSVP